MSFQELKTVTVRMFAERPIEAHPLFRALDDGALGPDAAKAVALQVYHVVAFFPRLLAALCARIEDTEARMSLVENLYCEHGRMDPRHVHLATYRDFLRALGISDGAIESSRPSVAVLAYTRGLFDLCSSAPLGEAVAAMGVVEEVVARVSPIVARFGNRATSVALGSHFSVHAKLDLSHADELYELAADWWTDSTRDDVLRGLEMGRYLQERLYTDLFPGRD